jgi:hypothetical protein
MCLRDKTVGWFEGLAEDGIDTNDWQVVRTEFLETYEPKYSTKTTCANFTDLNQKSDEPINDYTYHVQMAYKHRMDKKPAAMAAFEPPLELPQPTSVLMASPMPSNSSSTSSSWPD